MERTVLTMQQKYIFGEDRTYHVADVYFWSGLYLPCGRCIFLKWIVLTVWQMYIFGEDRTYHVADVYDGGSKSNGSTKSQVQILEIEIVEKIDGITTILLLQPGKLRDQLSLPSVFNLLTVYKQLRLFYDISALIYFPLPPPIAIIYKQSYLFWTRTLFGLCVGNNHYFTKTMGKHHLSYYFH